MSSPPTFARRTFLRSTGALLALPWLESLNPMRALGAESPRPRRFAFLYFPNGVNPSAWNPSATPEGALQLPPILEPLSAHRGDLVALGNLWNANARFGDGHYAKTAGLLTSTAITRTTGANVQSGGVSVDQRIARHIGRDARFRSLELGIEPVTTGIDGNVGYTRLYGAHIAWATPTRPLPCEISPRAAFDRLFRPPAPGPIRGSVLDQVRGEADRLRARIAPGDRRKMDEYLDSVRDLERRVELDETLTRKGGNARPEVAAQVEELSRRIDTLPVGVSLAEHFKQARGGDHTEHVRLMLDILAIAFWTDTTRVATFMFGNDVSSRDFSFLPGVHGAHHEISHHNHDAAKLEEYRIINTWHTAQFAYFLDRLKAMPEDGGSVLDNSIIAFGSSLRDGNAHAPENLPLLLAGRGGGVLKTGRLVEAGERTPLANLHLSLLNAFGIQEPRFADSTGPLGGML